MLYSPKKGEVMEEYQVIYVDRKTGVQTVSEITIHLYEGEVIKRQIEQSTPKTVVMFKKIINVNYNELKKINNVKNWLINNKLIEV